MLSTRMQSCLQYYAIKRTSNCLQTIRHLSKINTNFDEIKKFCHILNISQEFNENDLKNAFLNRVKQTHPDLNHDIDGHNDSQINDITNAYNCLKEYLKNRDNQYNRDMNDMEDEEDSRVNHTVPQHRQYLTFDGIGFGTPSDRQRQYQKHRLMDAMNNLTEFELNKIQSNHELSDSKSIALKESNFQRKIKIKQGFDRLVEDLIQESMAKGEFDNLSGYGKPLKYRPEYPYLDSMTLKLNEILINNGFVPEWILLQREITDERNAIKKELLFLKSDSKLNNISYIKRLLEEKVKEVNKKIEKYNRIVPILHNQQILVILEKEVNKLRELDTNEVNTRNDSQN